MTDLYIPNQLIYRTPDRNVAIESSNYTSFIPVAGSSFTPGQNFSIKIASPNEFLDFQKSYLKYNLTITCTGGSSTVGSSYLGGVQAIKRIVTNIGGVQIEDIQDYNVLCSLAYAKYTTERQNFLRRVEGYGVITSFIAGSDGATNGRVVTHSLQIAISKVQNYIGLPFIRGGLRLDFTLASLTSFQSSQGFYLDSNVVVSNVSFRGMMVKPTQAYLQQVQATMASGKSMKIPLIIVKSYNSQPVAVSSQDITYNIGIHQSLKGVIMCQRLVANVGASTTDDFKNYTLNNLKSYYIKTSGKRFPSNFEVSCSNVNTVTEGLSCEKEMIACCSIDNDFSGYNSNVDLVATTGAITSGTHNIDEFISYNFSPDNSFGSGIPTSDGIIQLALTYSSAPATSTVINTFIGVDALLEISQDTVTLNTGNL